MNNLLGRVAYVEGLLEGLREAITGRRVAEDSGKYEPPLSRNGFVQEATPRKGTV